MPDKVKLLTQAQYQALITGIPIYCAKTVFSVGGQTYSANQAVALIQSLLNATAATAAAKASAKQAVAAEEQVINQSAVVARAIRQIIALSFSKALPTLTAFGIQPRKAPRKLDTAQRAAATAKLEATRKARGITSKKQKAAISGNVTGVTITPIIGPSTTASATSPAGSTAVATSPAATTPAVPAQAATAPVTPPAAAAASAATSPVTPAASNGAAPVVSVHA